MVMRVAIFRIVVLTVILLIFGAFLATDSYSKALQDKASNFTLEGIDGKKVVLSDLLNDKKVVLVFWATWCPHCRSEIPHIEKFYKENKSKIAVIGINIGETKGKVASFAEKRKISYPIVLDPDSTVARAYKVTGIPAIVAIDRDSTILYFGHSLSEMEDAIKQLLK